MHRLLIADSDDIFLSIAREAFSAEFEVQTCQDGETALELLLSFRPQVLILNLSLPYKDGLTVLRQAATLPPVIIAITTILLPYIEQACADLNVGYLMISPCLNALRVQTIAMVHYWEANSRPKELRSQVVDHLQSLDFTRRTGYHDLCAAIPLFYQDREQCLDTGLYTAVGAPKGRTATAVERTIRTAIQDAWSRRDPAVWSKFFKDQSTCPSNKEFLEAIADHLYE